MPFDDITSLPRLDFAGRRVLLCADLFGPSDGVERLRPAIEPLLKARCKVLVAPQSSPTGDLAAALSTAFRVPIVELDHDFPVRVAGLEPGRLALCPPLPSYVEDAENDLDWAQRIARAVDVYVCEAPLAAREARASTVLLPQLLPSRGAGPQLASDLAMTRDFVEELSAPVSALIGGADLPRKAALLRALVERVDHLLLGGVVASTFLVAAGVSVHDTVYEPEGLEVARDILARARERGIELLLPTDGLVAPCAGAVLLTNRGFDQLDVGEAALDLGAETRARYEQVLRASATVICNGVLGEKLAVTQRLWAAAAESAPYSLIAGDSSVQHAARLGVSSRFRTLGTGGDTTLDLLAGAALPGIESLRR